MRSEPPSRSGSSEPGVDRQYGIGSPLVGKVNAIADGERIAGPIDPAWLGHGSYFLDTQPVAGHSGVTTANGLGLLGFALGSRNEETVTGTDHWIAAFANGSGAVENGIDGGEDFLDICYDEAAANGSVVVDLGRRTIELSIEWFDTMAASRALDVVVGYYGPVLAIASEDNMDVDPNRVETADLERREPRRNPADSPGSGSHLPRVGA